MSQLEKIYGVHAVEALLRHHPKRVKQIWLAEGRSDPRVQTLIALAAENRVAVGNAERRELDAWVEGVHQGVVADVSPSQVWGEAMLDELLDRTDGAPLLLVLDGVTDPHNLGACLRVADGAGAHAIIAPKDHAAGINATVAKVASGAAETVPYFMVTNLARTLGELKERSIWCIGTSEDAPKTIHQVDLKGPVALVLGAEGPGMRQLTRKTCDELVSIPMRGAVESLNVSVASGICLYEALRQRS
jgi:23S rRNA (guanosine2251-2'-O)-methyltransferase